MKKIAKGLCAALLLFSLAGCSDATTNVSDKNEAIITIGNAKITKGDVYESLLAQGDISFVTQALTKAIAAKAVETTEEIEDAAKTTMDALKSSNKDWEAYLEKNGYEDEKGLLNDLIIQVKESKLTSTYVNEKYNDLVSRFEPRKLQLVSIADNAKANEAIEKAKDGTEFSEIAKTYGNGKYNGEEAIYTNTSGLGNEVWKVILNTKEEEVASQVAYDPESGTYYLIKVIDSKTNNFKEEAISVIATLTTTNDEGLKIDEEAFKYFLNKFDYSIHDATVYSALLNNSSKYERVR